MRTSKGEIVTLLTVIAMVVMTLGVFIGSQMVAQQQLTTSSFAQQAPTISPNQANIDTSMITMSFGGILNRNENQKMTTGNLCFKSESQNPPNTGQYYIKAYARIKGQGPIEVGSSMLIRVQTQRGAFICPNQKKYDLFIYRNLNNVPGIPAGATVNDVESVVIHIETPVGTWEPAMSNPVATINNPGSLFDKTPGTGGGGGGPTNTPTPTTTPLTPEACPGLSAKVPAGILANALANPSSISGWGQPHTPGQPISSTNPARNKLTIVDPAQPYSATNGLVYKAYCVDPTPTPLTPEACPGLSAKVPAGILANALANPSSVPGWGLPHTSGSPIGPTNPARNKLSLVDPSRDYGIENGLVYKAYCTAPTPPANPTNTPTPTPTTGPTNTPTPVPQGGRTHNVSVSLRNMFTQPITKVALEACANNVECKLVEVEVNIPSRMLATIYFTFTFESSTINFITYPRLVVTVGSGFTGELGGSTITKKLDHRVNGFENSLMYISVGESETTSQAKTESQASDVSKDGCVNTNDAALLIPKLGTIEESLTSCSATDIDCNGFNNALDLSLIIDNLNQGFGCVYNQP